MTLYTVNEHIKQWADSLSKWDALDIYCKKQVLEYS